MSKHLLGAVFFSSFVIFPSICATLCAISTALSVLQLYFHPPKQLVEFIPFSCKDRVRCGQSVPDYRINCPRRAIVEELAGMGASVHTCSRNEQELGSCLNEWRELRYDVTCSASDVSLRHEREKLMAETATIFGGKLNMLVSFRILFYFCLELYSHVQDLACTIY